MTRTKMRESDLVLLMIAFAFAIATLAMDGCAGPPDAAWRATVYAGTAVEAADNVMVEKIEEIGADTLADARRMRAEMGEGEGAWTEGQAVAWYEQHYAERVDAYDPVRTGIRVAFRGLGAMNFALAAWEEGAEDGEGQWLSAAACTAASLVALVSAFEDGGLELPAMFSRAMTWLRPYAEGLCPGSEQ